MNYQGTYPVKYVPTHDNDKDNSRNVYSVYCNRCRLCVLSHHPKQLGASCIGANVTIQPHR